MIDADFTITKQNTIVRQNRFVADQEIPISYKGQIDQEYGILPVGLRSVEPFVSRHDHYNYTIVELAPHRRDIVFRHDMKYNLVGVNPTEDDYYSLPFPWMQFHMFIPSFEKEERTTDYQIKTFITLTATSFEGEDQEIIPLNLPNTTWPGNYVCIYGNALGIKNDHGMTKAEEIAHLSIGEISNNVIASVFGSGWNMNVTSWPEALPEEFDVELKNEAEIDRHEMYMYESDYHGLDVIREWENKSIQDMLELSTQSSIKSVVEEALDEMYIKSFPNADSLIYRLWRP